MSIELIISENIFFQDKYGDEAVKKVSRSLTFPINIYDSIIYYLEVNQQEVIMQDSILSDGTLIQ